MLNEKPSQELLGQVGNGTTIRHEEVRAIEDSEFRFIPQERKGTQPEGVDA